MNTNLKAIRLCRRHWDFHYPPFNLSLRLCLSGFVQTLMKIEHIFRQRPMKSRLANRAAGPTTGHLCKLYTAS